MRRAVLLLGTLGLLLTACGNGGGSAPGYISSTYTPSGSEASAAVYRSTDAPAKVLRDVVGEEQEAYRVVNARGTFLRYRDDFVGILPGTGAGSRILLADEDDGVGAFYPYIGNEFGQFVAEGGGPGDGGK